MGGPWAEAGTEKMLTVSVRAAPAHHPEAAVTLPCTPGNTTPAEAYFRVDFRGNYLSLILG